METRMAILMICFLTSENIVDIQNIVAVIIVITIVFDAFTWFRKHAARIPRRLILERWITYSIS